MISARNPNSSFMREIALLATITLIAINSVAESAPKENLKKVFVIFRHGDRTPDNNGYEMYPNDPYLHYDFYPTGLGQLTIEGKRREYRLGVTLKQRYGRFLGDIVTPNKVSALSSDYDRTKMSLQLVLAALFPPADIQKWNAELNWQPIAARYFRRLEDNVFLPEECPLYLAEYNRVLNSPKGQRQIGEYKEFMERLTNLTGKNMTSPIDTYYLYHTLMAEYSMDLPLPDWAYSIFPYGKLWNATILQYDIGNANTLLKRLYGGPLVRIITENMISSANGTEEDETKIHLFSGHETNIAAVLYALGLFTPHVPQYSSALFIEYHEIDGANYVKILHYIGIPPVVTELRMPGCDVLCPLETFLKLTSDVIPSDEEMICDKTLTKDYANFKPPSAIETMTYNLIRTSRNVRNE